MRASLRGTAIDQPSYPIGLSREGGSSAIGQFVMLAVVILLGLILIPRTADDAVPATIVVFTLVATAGLGACMATVRRLPDPRLDFLGYLWLGKLAFTLFLLWFSWVPGLLDTGSASWGYDAQRFYFESRQLVDDHWNSDFVSLNYVGILYYFGALFHFIGFNPVLPALLNSVVTLLCALFLIRACYATVPTVGPRHWLIALCLIHPEVFWFDIQTSRETLIGACTTVCLVAAGRYIARPEGAGLLSTLLLCVTSLLVISAVRTSIVLPIVVAMACFLLLSRGTSRSFLQKLLIAALGLAAVAMAPVISGYLGSFGFVDISETLRSVVEASENATLNDETQWSESSIGARLAPEGPLQAVLFLLPRLIIYLIAPLPDVFLSFTVLAAGWWSEWQRLFTIGAALLNVALVPYAAAGFLRGLLARPMDSMALVFPVSYWVLMIAVAGGNIVIHERYRVLAVPLLCASAWLGATTCTKAQIRKAMVVWYTLIAVGASFYLIVKFT